MRIVWQLFSTANLCALELMGPTADTHKHARSTQDQHITHSAHAVGVCALRLSIVLHLERDAQLQQNKKKASAMIAAAVVLGESLRATSDAVRDANSGTRQRPHTTAPHSL